LFNKSGNPQLSFDKGAYYFMCKDTVKIASKTYTRNTLYVLNFVNECPPYLFRLTSLFRLLLSHMWTDKLTKVSNLSCGMLVVSEVFSSTPAHPPSWYTVIACMSKIARKDSYILIYLIFWVFTPVLTNRSYWSYSGVTLNFDPVEKWPWGQFSTVTGSILNVEFWTTCWILNHLLKVLRSDPGS
jgi:hypothetical protein